MLERSSILFPTRKTLVSVWYSLSHKTIIQFLHGLPLVVPIYTEQVGNRERDPGKLRSHQSLAAERREARPGELGQVLQNRRECRAAGQEG